MRKRPTRNHPYNDFLPQASSFASGHWSLKMVVEGEDIVMNPGPRPARTLSRQSSTGSLSDRCIPKLEKQASWKMEMSAASYDRLLAENMFGEGTVRHLENNRVLSYDTKAPLPLMNRADEERVVYTVKKAELAISKSTRVVPTRPFRILDAPSIKDEYYCNVVDWSKRNVVAVALGHSVYLWNGETAQTDELMSLQNENDYIASVRWSDDGGYLAIGTSTATIQIWDVHPTGFKHLRTFREHTKSVNALSWSLGLLTSGSRDREIHYHDSRVKDHMLGRFKEHSGKICALEWDREGRYLASGAGDNQACVIDSRKLTMPVAVLDEHRAAVKALAWCPWRSGLLATGAGSNDKCVRLWNATSGECLHRENTGSQVTGIHCSSADNEILTSHGYDTNQLCLWKYQHQFPSMRKMAELEGHSARILGIAPSPDGSVVLSASADQTIQFWRLFERKKKSSKSADVLRQGAELFKGIR